MLPVINTTEVKEASFALATPVKGASMNRFSFEPTNAISNRFSREAIRLANGAVRKMEVSVPPGRGKVKPLET